MANKDTLCTIIIPSFDNYEYLSGALNSLLRNQGTPGMMRIIVVNNGHPKSCDWIEHKQVEVIQAGKNLGWEGGIAEGLKYTTSEFVCFFNDDAYIPPCSRLWLNKLLDHFKNPKVGAVGPSSNVVMGSQNIFVDTGQVTVFPVTYLIGFCVVVRREAFDKVGGMDMDLPSGDDLDWSIRLRDAGYSLLVDREVFVYHHGFKTGTRVMGDHQTSGGWNSYEMQERTNHALIKKHGLKKWFETVRGGVPSSDTFQSVDTEGDLIRSKIIPQDKVILDLGVGNKKTVEGSIGIDRVPQGKVIDTLDGVSISQADIISDVTKPLPVEDGSVDTIIARHVLEHVIDPIPVLANWISKLKVGGRLILAVPNQEWHNTIPMNSEHVVAYTPESLTHLLQVFGLKIESVEDPKNYIGFVAVSRRVE